MVGKQVLLGGRTLKIIKLLGKGKGGYSYLAQTTDGKPYVLKQIHHEPCSYYQFGDKLSSELRDYERLTAVGIRMPELIDVDAQHERLLKEYIDGPTAYELVQRDELKPEHIEQVQKMCSALYAAGLNIDYFPTNFILQNGLLFYIDYECNEFMEEWSFESWGVKYWSKTPELIEYVKEHS